VDWNEAIYYLQSRGMSYEAAYERMSEVSYIMQEASRLGRSMAVIHPSPIDSEGSLILGMPDNFDEIVEAISQGYVVGMVELDAKQEPISFRTLEGVDIAFEGF